jgi:hypothetical protein
VTSITLRPEERELLERLALTDDVNLAEVWRRSLRAYARDRGLLVGDDTAEVRPAA